MMSVRSRELAAFPKRREAPLPVQQYDGRLLSGMAQGLPIGRDGSETAWLVGVESCWSVFWLQFTEAGLGSVLSSGPQRCIGNADTIDKIHSHELSCVILSFHPQQNQCCDLRHSHRPAFMPR